MPQIRAFLFDAENETKFAAHGIRPEQVDQILDEAFIVARNRKQRRAAYLVIGRDWGGACIAVPTEPTNDPTVWRPVTAWPCKAAEAARLDRST
jgi:uncharacterized DUF497 family protein